jgi:quercetin dioxygenase-like cupin family protein
MTKFGGFQVQNLSEGVRMKGTSAFIVGVGSLIVVLALCTISLLAQDALQVAPKNFKVLTENKDVRVLQDTLAPGEKEPMHTHPAGWYYVTQPGKMKVTYADGKSTIWEAKPGEQAWMEAEEPHTSENIGDTPVSYILVEVKSAAKK